MQNTAYDVRISYWSSDVCSSDLGALDGFSEDERLGVNEMPELERYILHLLFKLDEELIAAANAFEFNRYIRALTDFANNDLSAFFFDIRKDILYCDAPASPKRRAYRSEEHTSEIQSLTRI